MNESSSKQRGTPSNGPHDEDVFSMMLEAMSVAELNSALEEALENMTEENYDPALINAYLEALDRKDPIPEIPDAEAAYAGFQERLGEIFPGRDNKATTPIRKLHRAWRVGLVAALAIICMIGAMVVAEAAGLNVFGTMAQWTDTIFSLGAVRSEGAEDELNHPASGQTANGVDGDAEYETLQAALDAYGITEVSEPAWIPDGYTLHSMTVDCWPDGTLIALRETFSNESIPLHVEVIPYYGEPLMQVEKNDAPMEIFTVNEMSVYLLENNKNNMAAWATEHYECYISGAVDKSDLKKIVLSAYGEYETLQTALEAYGIMEFSEPAWMPEEYALESMDVLCRSDGTLLFLTADYTDGISHLQINIDNYVDEPYSQIEKTGAPIETFEVNGLLVYLLENTNNNAAAWATEHYEYCVSGAVDKSVLQQIVLSAYGESGFDDNG